MAKTKNAPTELTEVEELQKQCDEKDAVIAELSKKLGSLSSSAKLKHVVEHDEKKYEVVPKSFFHNKKEVKAEDLSANKKLVAELVESGSSFLKEI